mmetsp:Transcript_5455/g.8926  ORF Transcript_5455/g.8926 Transcript_5455/m.8926 type:complete len:83 (+) Transcript_5455:1027-1275(+)
MFTAVAVVLVAWPTSATTSLPPSASAASGASGASGAGAAGGGGTGAIGTRTRDLLGEDLSPPQAPEDTDRGTAPGVSGDFAF